MSSSVPTVPSSAPAVPTTRWVAPAIAILRVYAGAVFFSNGVVKLLPWVGEPFPEMPFGHLVGNAGALQVITNEAARHPIEPYRVLVSDIIVPNWSLFGPLLGIGEAGFGLLLILGLLTPVAALVLALMSLHLQFMTLFNNKFLFEYSLYWVPLLCLAAMHAGRFAGLDARLAARRPAWWN